LSQTLAKINTEERYKEWGYGGFFDYCKQELDLTVNTVKDMISAYEYLKKNEPSKLNTIGDPDVYIPDYYSLSQLGKAKDAQKIDDNKEKELRDKLFDGPTNDSEVLKEIKEKSKVGEQNPLNDIALETKDVKKLAKKLNNKIHNTSAFSDEVVSMSDKLLEMIDKVTI
jgi:hypothetical protein